MVAFDPNQALFKPEFKNILIMSINSYLSRIFIGSDPIRMISVTRVSFLVKYIYKTGSSIVSYRYS